MSPEKLQQMRSIIKRIAYPGRGTADESATVDDFANEILAIFSLSELEEDEAKKEGGQA